MICKKKHFLKTSFVLFRTSAHFHKGAPPAGEKKYPPLPLRSRPAGGLERDQRAADADERRRVCLRRLGVLDAPELLTTFEGFGATLEVGLPFLRGAGIPLPAALTLSALDVDGGAINVRGRVTLEPIDYSELARLADELRAAAAAPPRTVTVDATTAEGDGGPPPPGRPALPA